MTTEAIVSAAIPENLSIIAITDHNEINNVPRALTAAACKQLLVIPGVELSTRHLLVYFDDHEDLEAFYGKLNFADRGKQENRTPGDLERI